MSQTLILDQGFWVFIRAWVKAPCQDRFDLAAQDPLRGDQNLPANANFSLLRQGACPGQGRPIQRPASALAPLSWWASAHLTSTNLRKISEKWRDAGAPA